MNKPAEHKSVFLLLYKLTLKELLRNRLGLLLLFVIPALFLAVVEWTSGRGSLPIKLHYFRSIHQVMIDQREISLVFISAAIGGFLMSYYAILLFHQDFEFFRYCIFLRLSPVTFVTARFGFFFTLVAVLGIFSTLLLRFSMSFSSIAGAWLGFVLLGIIYGAYGGIVGILSRDFMVAILFIALLANLDAGWLQNPVFYSTAQQTEIIRWLPAFYPCQFIFSSIFGERINSWAVLMSIAYASILLGGLFLAVRFKIKGVYHGNKPKKH